MPKLRACVVTALALFVVAAQPASAEAQKRFRTCMSKGGFTCAKRIVEGDIPYASFKDRSGKRPWVRVCVKDREGRRCWPRRRARSGAILYEPILYRTIGRHVTTWRVKGKVVGRWRWRVVSEPEGG
jgi:hypothetical protein